MIYEVVVTIKVTADNSVDAARQVLGLPGGEGATGDLTYLSIEPVEDPAHA